MSSRPPTQQGQTGDISPNFLGLNDLPGARLGQDSLTLYCVSDSDSGVDSVEPSKPVSRSVDSPQDRTVKFVLRIATLAIQAVGQSVCLSVCHSHFVTHEIFSVWLNLIQYIALSEIFQYGWI